VKRKVAAFVGSLHSTSCSGKVSVSPGAISAFGANHQLQQSLVFLTVPCLPMPAAHIGDITAFADWVERNANAS
jgi:hypothetical protein